MIHFLKNKKIVLSIQAGRGTAWGSQPLQGKLYPPGDSKTSGPGERRGGGRGDPRDGAALH